MEETEIKKFSFWNFAHKNFLIYYPILVVVGISAINMIFDLDPLIETGLRMIMYIAFGCQWIGFVRYYEKSKLEGMKADKDLLKNYAELSQLTTGESMVKYMVPYHGTFMSRIWYKMRNRTVLSLFVSQKMGRFKSFTKFYATEKEMFEMKLKGCINTYDSELALKGLQCLSKGKKLKIIL